MNVMNYRPMCIFLQGKIEFYSNLFQLKTHQDRSGFVGGSTSPPPKFRSFDKVEPDCKMSVKYLVFLFQNLN